MARNVFFSFHYARDIRRVVQVRNSWVVRGERDTQPFLDKVEWEKIERDDKAVEAWIERQLTGTSVTVVLFGKETYDRKWVKHEIKRSYELGKGILAIDIHNIKDPQYGTDTAGKNPLGLWKIKETHFTSLYKTYDWVTDDGYNNISKWIETAANAAKR